ncbi:MAG TPA: hypothetical protein VJ810_19115 [Blastocatellia bacterium]|nr:hypothetical protein [Blastocatellia bacterium]
MYRIVQANKLAVVLGVEIDNIGNFNQIPMVQQPDLLIPVLVEINRLYRQGIRYIFPIHLTDNVFGGSAIYMTQSNWANYRESLWPSRVATTQYPGSGNFFQVECAAPGDDIGFKYETSTGDSVLDGIFAGVRHTKLGIPPTVFPPRSPDCPAGRRNAKELTYLGAIALKEMMRLGYHERCADQAVSQQGAVRGRQRGLRDRYELTREAAQTAWAQQHNVQLSVSEKSDGLQGMGLQHGGRRALRHVRGFHTGRSHGAGKQRHLGRRARGRPPFPQRRLFLAHVAEDRGAGEERAVGAATTQCAGMRGRTSGATARTDRDDWRVVA